MHHAKLMKNNKTTRRPSARKKNRKLRYAVVGLGHIAQTAVLPAFKNARRNSEVTALVSEDPAKLEFWGRKLKVKALYATERFEALCQSGEIDAVYIATPNTDHARFIETALKHDIHVLTEKPMVASSEQARRLKPILDRSRAQLMVAYRLHFDRPNLTAAAIANSGRLGDIRFFTSTFSMQVEDPDNIRLKSAKGGGPLFDIGIYCINAARSIFRDEPVSVFAVNETVRGDARFRDVPEMVTAVLRFPKNRVATFTCSFGAAALAHYEVVGTKGWLCLDSSYEYAEGMSLEIGVGERTRTREFKKRDQFAPELVYFSDCVLKRRRVEPSFAEGLNDLLVIEALEKSARTGRAVDLRARTKTARPTLRQEMRRPPQPKPRPENMIHITTPHS